MAASENANELELERGIISNVQTFSAVFKRIFLKYGRDFDENENGGAVINFGDELFEEGLSILEDKPANPITNVPDDLDDLDDEEDVIITGEDVLNPQLATKLHERVLLIKKEINWSDEEDIAQEAQLLTDTSQMEYEDIHSCSDTCDSDIESDVSFMSPPGKQKLTRSVTLNLPSLTKEDGATTNKDVAKNTNRIKFPVLKIAKAQIRVRRVFEPQPSQLVSCDLHTPQYYTRGDHHYPPSEHCSCCLDVWPVQSPCACPCSVPKYNVCSCPSCKNIPPFNPPPLYTVSTGACQTCCETPLVSSPASLNRSEQLDRPPILYQRVYSADVNGCDCPECVAVHRPPHESEQRREKRPLDDQYCADGHRMIKKHCT